MKLFIPEKSLTFSTSMSNLLLFSLSFRFEYLWQDDVKFKKPTAVPAVQYISFLMDWIEGQINNEDIFPTKTGKTTNFQWFSTKCNLQSMQQIEKKSIDLKLRARAHVCDFERFVCSFFLCCHERKTKDRMKDCLLTFQSVIFQLGCWFTF